MKNTKLALASLFLGLSSSLALADPVTYTFDTLTKVTMDGVEPAVVGVLRNDTAVANVIFRDQTNITFQYVVNRCVPLFLTMIEKPGRYWLSVTVDRSDLYVQLKSCSLELRS